MSTKQFGLSLPEKRWVDEQAALIFCEGGSFTRSGVMRDLQKLFIYCYRYGINPLPGLRKCFPALVWRQWKQRGMKHIGELMQIQIRRDADLIWPLSETEVVSASRVATMGGHINDEMIFWFNRISQQTECMPRDAFSVSWITSH